MIKEIRFVIDADSGDLDILNEDGQMLSSNSKEVKSIQQYLACEEIREDLINRDEVKYNEELKNNISLVIDNYYIESMLMIQQNRDSLFRLAVAATRDIIENLSEEIEEEYSDEEDFEEPEE